MSRSGRVAVALGAPVLVVLVAACGGDAPSSGLPTIGASSSGGAGTPTVTVTPTATPSSRWTPEQQQVLDRYRDYYRVVTSMGEGVPLDMASLKSVATAAWAQEIGQNTQVMKAEGFVAEYPPGGIRRDIVSVSVDGVKATIVSCEDATGTRLIKRGTPEPSSSDTYKPTRRVVSLSSVGGTWKVARLGGESSC